MTENPSTEGRREPTASPPRAVPRRSWVANVGQWLFAYTVAWSVFTVLALALTLLWTPGVGGIVLVAISAWIVATVAALASSDEPKEPGTAARRYGVAVLMSVPGLLIALVAALTAVFLPVLLIFGAIGSPILPWLHRGSPPWQRALLSGVGLVATALLLWIAATEGADSWTEAWILVAGSAPLLGAGSATGALFALRTVGVPHKVG